MKSNIFWIMGSLLFLFTIVIADDNDEECLLCDAMVGAAVAVCQEFAACRSFMFFLTITSIFVCLIIFIFGGPETRREMWGNVPSYRRLGAAAGGYGLTRTFM